MSAATITVLIVENETPARIVLEQSLTQACTQLGVISESACQLVHAHKWTPEALLQSVHDTPVPILIALDIQLDTDTTDMDRMLKQYVQLYVTSKQISGTTQRRALIVYTKEREIVRLYRNQEIPPMFIVPKWSERGRDRFAQLQSAFEQSLRYLRAADAAYSR